MNQTITLKAATIAEYRDFLRAARKLPVTVSGYITGGTWEDADGEALFAYSARIPILREIQRPNCEYVTVEADGQPCAVKPGSGPNYYCLVLEAR